MDSPAEMDSPVEIPTLSIKLWPPSENTRLLLTERMIKNLTTPSIFSRKYGILSIKDAEVDAKDIEEVAYVIAQQHFDKEPDGDGSSAVQLYAKESSKRMLEVLKRGPKTKECDEVTDMVSEETILDISGAKRAFIEAEEAQELLKPLTKLGNKYNKICFSNRSFGLEAARVVVPILSSVKGQLREVDLSDFIAGRSEEEAIEVMEMFSEALEGSDLKYLNLSNNALGEKGVRAFASLLKSQYNLEELYLMNDGISEEAARAVCELIPSTEKLKILHFHNNMTGDEGALAIAELVKKSPLLEDFQCSSTRVGSEGGIALVEALGTCKNLKKLDIRDNMFGVAAGVALSEVLEVFSGLTEIYLSYLNLEDEGSKALAVSLTNCAPYLEVLDISGNDITAENAPVLAACIASKRHLTKLNLSENEFKDDGTILIAKALEECSGKLIEVDMSTNLMRRVGARTLAQVVLKKSGFKLLNLNSNFISDEGVDELKELFKNNPEMLGPLDENDPEGEEYDDEGEEDEGGEGDDGEELGAKLKDLQIKTGE